jgi:hypothetical protein
LIVSILFFILHGGKIVEPGVTAMRVVPGFDEREDSHSCFDLGLEPASVEEYAFQNGEEALAQGVVEAITTDPVEGRTWSPCTVSRQ